VSRKRGHSADPPLALRALSTHQPDGQQLFLIECRERKRTGRLVCCELVDRLVRAQNCLT
jgi:hypothetical protein